jgi:hypothetical protein
MSIFQRTHLAVANATCGNPVVFHHVPKCAGTSIERALRLRYAASYATFDLRSIYSAAEALYGTSSLNMLDKLTAEFRSTEFLTYLYDDVRCIAGHIYFSNLAFETFSHKYKFVTVLRDPVDFFISFFYQLSGAKRSYWSVDMPLDEFLCTDQARLLGQFYALYFSGDATNLEDLSPSSVCRAKDNIAKFSAVGFVDDTSGFQRQLTELLGVRLWIGHSNRSKASHSERNGLTHELRSRILGISSANIDIYNAARRLFTKRAEADSPIAVL